MFIMYTHLQQPDPSISMDTAIPSRQSGPKKLILSQCELAQFLVEVLYYFLKKLVANVREVSQSLGDV